ncbi:MAG: hypothetical protein HYT20_03565 [Candidatus Nealsonbacteria bacterium]|nr:hypothetical protein [Candidatus Nealsonbacteria bacterium]
MAAVFKNVFCNWQYALLAVVIFILVLAFSIWLPNLSFLRHTVESSSLSLTQKLYLLVSSLGALGTNFSPLSRILTVLISLFFGINMSLLSFYFKTRFALQRAAGASMAGILSGLLGIGCASCGSVILTSLFGLSATASFIGILPLKGQEFGLLGIGILGFSIFFTAKKIKSPAVCIRKTCKT